VLFDFFFYISFYGDIKSLFLFKILRYFVFVFLVIFLLYWFDLVTINLCFAATGEISDPHQIGAVINDIAAEEQLNQESNGTEKAVQNENVLVFGVDIKKLEIVATAIVIVISCTAIVGGEIYARFFWKK
jgi:hypothetical protein